MLGFFAFHLSVHCLFLFYALRQSWRSHRLGRRGARLRTFCALMVLFFALELPLAVSKAEQPYNTSVGPTYAYALHVLASGTLFGLLSTGVMSFLEYLGAPCLYRRQMVLLSLVFVCWSVSVDVQLLNALVN